MQNILLIGAHFDDIEIGCTGTILKHIAAGDNIMFAITSIDESRTGDVMIRAEEQNESAKKFELPDRFLYFFSESDEISFIVSILDTLCPDIVFAPHESDTHQAHRRSSIIAQAVGRKRHITTMFYDSGSSYDFSPNVFSFINFDKKLEILECYKSQIEHGAINLDILKKKNAYWASLLTDIPDSYAEGFMVRKMIYGV